MIPAAIVMLVAAGACFLARAVAGPSLADRVLALDALVITIVAAIPRRPAAIAKSGHGGAKVDPASPNRSDRATPM